MAAKSNKTDNRHNQAQDPEETIENALGRTEIFIHNHGKTLLTVFIVVLLVVGGFFSYKYLYMGKRADKAGTAMFIAEQQFAVDSFQLALAGDGNIVGFLDIIKDYGSTPQGNIACHYAGICYLKLGNTAEALRYLEKYKPVSGVPSKIINAQNYGLRGDIHSDNGEYDKAIAAYRKAADDWENSLTTPIYLKKLGLVYSAAGKNAEAVKAFQRIADEYPTSMEGRDAEKYIGMMEQK